MLRVLFLFLILIASIILGPMLAGHQGYVLIQTNNYNIETSITALVIAMVLLFVLLLAIGSILRRIFHTGSRTQSWFSGRKRQRANQQTKAALLKLAEGDYQQVEALLTRSAKHAEQPVVNYLLAAEAAQQRGDQIRTLQYLELAAQLAENNQLPVDITRVRLQLAQGQMHAARHGVDQLLNQVPRHPEVLRLAQQAYLATGAYGSLLEILPSMYKIDLYPEDQILALQQQAYIGLMDQAMADEGSEGLLRWWKDQSRKVRHEIPLQVALAEHLLTCDDHAAAQEIILEGLKRQYDQRLVLLMPRLDSDKPEQLLKMLRQQIKQHGKQPLLSSVLGQLLFKQGEWQAASEALQEALQQRPDAHDYAYLADTLDHLQQPELATQMRQAGFKLSLK
ncbi:protoheme IX biogenesis protein HemY [Serratia microhaemolytica]|uniref:protoheme IX biogenesis protein HemY n=1 Tax=Serratia microhaemolytica TaxID=2675110 RepID=UPI000FDE3042|nr:protoheme IX biogenesis protein HemY [Serratia microhaemolytica]